MNELRDPHEPGPETSAVDTVPRAEFEVPDGMMLVPTPQVLVGSQADPNDVARHIQDSFIAGLGQKSEPTIDEQLAETLNADSDPADQAQAES
jgi:hypothetical protein